MRFILKATVKFWQVDGPSHTDNVHAHTHSCCQFKNIKHNMLDLMFWAVRGN